MSGEKVKKKTKLSLVLVIPDSNDEDDGSSFNDRSKDNEEGKSGEDIEDPEKTGKKATRIEAARPLELKDTIYRLAEGLAPDEGQQEVTLCRLHGLVEQILDEEVTAAGRDEIGNAITPTRHHHLDGMDEVKAFQQAWNNSVARQEAAYHWKMAWLHKTYRRAIRAIQEKRKRNRIEISTTHRVNSINKSGMKAAAEARLYLFT